VLEF